MNIDRSLFLAFAASLSAASAVGCSSGDDASASDSPEVVGAEYCWTPHAESASGPAHDHYVGELGFDPIADYPAAEGFCFRLAAPNGVDWDGPDEAIQLGVYDKCQSFALNFVPLTTYRAFVRLKEIPRDVPAIEKWGYLYAIDATIAAERFACRDEVSIALCERDGEGEECVNIATQIREPMLGAFSACLDRGYSAYSCVEGGRDFN